jgi:hypothetical protein
MRVRVRVMVRVRVRDWIGSEDSYRKCDKGKVKDRMTKTE